MLATKGKILESNPDVEFGSPFKTRQSGSQSFQRQDSSSRFRDSAVKRRHVYRSATYGQNDLFEQGEPDDSKSKKNLNKSEDVSGRKKKDYSYLLKRLETVP